LVFKDPVRTGVTEAGHAVGQAHCGSPRESTLGRCFRRLP
jgi:hypothetical protein